MANNPFRTLATLSLFLVFGLAHAQQDGDLVEADPPDRAARLSLIRGDVTMRPAGEQDWAPAILNRPLTTGDELWTEPGARAEIQVGRSAVRLSENTGFSFLEVNDDTIQMRMTAGVLTVRVRAIASDEDIEIDTPNLALSLLEPGSYRVEVNEEGDTTVVKVDDDGEAEAHGPTRDTVVHSGQAATFRGFDHIDADVARLGPRDEFDSWNRDRDEQYDRVASSRTAEYVSPDVTGYEDLDQHGSWSSEAEYGYVWTPRYLGADWSPYRFGRWVWVSPWGWTWIDDAPWGYAPFHYGRWAHVRNRWCWVPGPRHVRAVYAPALVGWVDGGANVTVVRGGRVGWFPLGPREVYVPARRYSHRYFDRVNNSNTIIQSGYLANAYARRDHNHNYRNRGAVTVVDRGTFTSAGRVGDRRVRVDDGEMARSRATAQAPQVDPVRASRLGEIVRTNQRRPPQGVAERRVVVRRNPPEAERQLARAQVERRARQPENRDRPRDGDGNRNRESNVQAPATTRELQPRADRPSREQNQNREQQTREVQARREAEVRQEQQRRGEERRRQFDQQQAEDQQLREQSARARQEREQQQGERLDRRDVQRQQQDQERERRVHETRERRDAQVEQLRQRQDDQQREARDQQRQQQERQQQESRRQLYEQQREARDHQRQQQQQQPQEQRQQQQERRQQAEQRVERTRTEEPRQERTERPAPSQKPVEARPPPRERAENRARERKN